MNIKKVITWLAMYVVSTTMYTCQVTAVPVTSQLSTAPTLDVTTDHTLSAIGSSTTHPENEKTDDMASKSTAIVSDDTTVEAASTHVQTSDTDQPGEAFSTLGSGDDTTSSSQDTTTSGDGLMSKLQSAASASVTETTPSDAETTTSKPAAEAAELMSLGNDPVPVPVQEGALCPWSHELLSQTEAEGRVRIYPESMSGAVCKSDCPVCEELGPEWGVEAVTHDTLVYACRLSAVDGPVQYTDCKWIFKSVTAGCVCARKS